MRTYSLSSYVLFIGTFLTYLPQIIVLFIRRTSFGLSLWNQVLFQFQSFCQMATVVLQQLAVFRCCKVWKLSVCSEDLTVVNQQATNFLCIWIIYLEYVIFHKSKKHDSDSEKRPESFRKAFGLFLLSQFVCVVLAGIALAFVFLLGEDAEEVKIYADVLSVAASLFTCVAQIPQIHETWMLRSVGSLSVLTLVLQTPGLRTRLHNTHTHTHTHVQRVVID